MRKRIRWVSEIVRDLFAGRGKSATMTVPSKRLTLEPLEHRLVLSASVPTLPHLNGINLSVPGDAFVLAGTVESTAYTAMTKWSQAGGLGSTVTITYSYSNLLDGRIGLSAGTVKATIQEALSRWAAVAPLRFVEVPDAGPAPSTGDYIQGNGPMIRFGHLTIDGPSKTLAYGYYPGYSGLSGDILFDDSENWSTNPNSGHDLLEIAEHEIGHALGLAHEPPPSAGGLDAIMNPYYGSRFHGLGTSYLLGDDINGIRALYGAGSGAVVPYNPVPNNPAPTGFSLRGTTLYITGTAGADTVLFAGAGSGSVSLNGVSYNGSLDAVRTISIDTRAGQDTVSITGSSSAETFVLKPNSVTMSGPRWNLSAVNSETIDVTGGAGDGVTFNDSPESDSFVASPTTAALSGVGYSLVANGFGSVTAQMVNGGDDRAWLYGSAGSDFFVSTPSMSHLYGTGYSITAMNFHAVYAYGSGGSDSATLGGSTGNDTVYASPTSTRLQANNGSFTTIASGFGSVVVDPGAGTNSAYLTGSAGNDVAVTTPSRVTLSGQRFSLTMNNFQVVNVKGGGGYDRATLNDSASNDIFQGSPTSVTLRRADNAFQYQLTGFAAVTVNATAGGIDTANLTDSTGIDNLIVKANSTILSGAGYSIRVNGFEKVNVTSVGGKDRVSVFDGPGNDTFSASGKVATMAYPSTRVQLTNFASASLFSTAGGVNKRKVGSTSMDLDFWGAWE